MKEMYNQINNKLALNEIKEDDKTTQSDRDSSNVFTSKNEISGDESDDALKETEETDYPYYRGAVEEGDGLFAELIRRLEQEQDSRSNITQHSREVLLDGLNRLNKKLKENIEKKRFNSLKIEPYQDNQAIISTTTLSSTAVHEIEVDLN